MKTLGVFILLSWLSTSFAFAQQNKQQKDTIQKLDEVTVSAQQILGSKFQACNRTGSAYYISLQEIQKMGYTDINRMLKAVPGVNVYEEDGYGDGLLVAHANPDFVLKANLLNPADFSDSVLRDRKSVGRERV